MKAVYNRHAYLAAVYAEAARLLRDRYFNEDGQKVQLLCETVFFSDREVPEDMIKEGIERIERAALREDQKRDEFLRRFDVEDAPVEVGDDDEEEPVKQAQPPKRQRKRANA